MSKKNTTGYGNDTKKNENPYFIRIFCRFFGAKIFRHLPKWPQFDTFGNTHLRLSFIL